MPNARGERVHGSLCVVALPVEATIDEPLDLPSQGLEEREYHEGRGRHRERVALGDSGEECLQRDDARSEQQDKNRSSRATS